MTAFDYALLILLGCSVIIGTKRGVVREMLSLASWVVAFLVANRFSGEVASMLPKALVEGALLRLVIAFIVLLLVVRIVMMLVIRASDAVIRAGGLSGLNRLLGAAFGLARGALLGLILVLLCGMTAIPQEPFWKNARFSPFAEEIALWVVSHMPAGIAQNIRY